MRSETFLLTGNSGSVLLDTDHSPELIPRGLPPWSFGVTSKSELPFKDLRNLDLACKLLPLPQNGGKESPVQFLLCQS